MLDKVKARLISLGYAVTDTDDNLINFIIKKVENEIKTECNISKIPSELEEVEIDMVCGEFLLIQKNNGKLKVEQALKSVKDGNITITFDEKMSDERKLDVFIDYLINGKRGEILCYRRIKWN